MSMKEAFTRFVHAFVQVSKDPWDPVPVLDLYDVDWTGLSCPGRDGTLPVPVWQPMEDKKVKKMTRGMVSPVSDFWTGTGYERPLIRAFEWTADTLQRVGKDLEVENGQETFCFDVTAVELYLFDTGVGLIVIETRLIAVKSGEVSRTPTLDDLIEFNARLKTYGGKVLPTLRRVRDKGRTRDQGAESAEQTLPERIRDGHDFALRDLAAWSLSPLDPMLERKGGRRVEMDASEMLVFTYALIPPTEPDHQVPPDDMGVALFRLRRGYNHRYRPSEAMHRIENNAEVYRPFDGVLHGIAIEGAAILVLDDGETPFFREMADRARHRYFALYLLTLHQRVVLERLATCSSRFHRLRLGVRGRREDVTPAARRLREAAFDFTLHHTFPWVGAITMYQEFYERLLSVMRVRELHEDLRDDLRELDELLERMDREAREAKDREDTRRRKGLETAVAVLFPVTLLLAFWGTNFREVVTTEQATTGFGDRDAWVSYVVTAFVILCFLVWVWWPDLKKLLRGRGKPEHPQ